MFPVPSEKIEQFDLVEKEEETLPPEIIRSEVNLFVLPFFALSREDVHKRVKTEYRAIVKRGNEKLEIHWKVSSNPEYGYPGPFDKEMHKAVEQIISKLPLPIENPICIGSLRTLSKRMGIEKPGKNIYKLIKKALIRLRTTSVQSKGAFYCKAKEEWIEDIFGLYDRVIFKGEKLDSGEIADNNYIFLNSWYLDNINNRYVKPIDYNYYRLLKTPIATRLYELLSVKFYGLGRKEGFIRYKYSTLSDLLPVIRQKYLSDAKGILDPAHKKLKETEFLAGYTWEDIPSSQSRQKEKDWYILYYPGKRVKEEIKKFRTYRIETEREGEELEPLTLSETKPESGLKGETKSELPQSQLKLIKRLESFGVSKIVAEDLMQHSKSQTIKNWMEAIQYRSDVEDKAAYLVKAVRENWQFPESFLKEKQARKEEKRRRRILKRMEAEQVKNERVELISSSPEFTEVWQNVLSELEQNVNRTSFETWLKNTALLGIEKEIAFVAVPNKFTKEYLQTRLQNVIKKAVAKILDREMDLDFVILSDDNH